MPYRLAIAISGAVSLGSYEAGVMFEVIRAIGMHNKAVSNEDDQIKIDILTGASAGGMTAAILAQKLLFEAESLEHPNSNHLYEPWVNIADVKGMLQELDGDDPDKSILSSAFIASIAEQYLLARYQGNNNSKHNPHPAAAESIRIGLALSNMNGVDYGINVFDGAELANPTSTFTYTKFQDSFTRIASETADNRAFWEEISTAARACGAFPFAFRPLHVSRKSSEYDYQDANLQERKFPDHAFTYTDGGVFNNSPLGMAKSLAEALDTEPRDYERRFYLYVSPDRKGSTANLSIQEENASMLATAKALFGSIFQQGRFQDWIMTANFNQIIQEFDERAYGLRELLRRIPDSERDAMTGVADHLLDHIYANREKGKPSREQDFNRLKQQFMMDREAQTLLDEQGEQSIEAWIKSVQVLEQSGRLGNKDEMRVYTITASDEELAGEGMAAFAGFFDSRFREFDYAVGRMKSREFLQNLKSQVQNYKSGRHLPLTAYELPNDLPAVSPSYSNATIADVDEQVRQALAERFTDRTERLLEQVGVSWLMRKPLMWFYIKGKIQEILKLK